MNTEMTILFVWAMWLFYTYGPPPLLHYFFTNAYFLFDDAIMNFNKIMYPDYWEVSSDSSSETVSNAGNEAKNETTDEPKPIPKYEDKYVDVIRKISKEWQFTEDEMVEKNDFEIKCLNDLTENIRNRIQEISNSILELDKEIKNDKDVINYIENCNEYGDELVEETTLEERNEYRKEQIDELTEELNTLNKQIETEEGLHKLKSDAASQATNYIIKNRINKLQNCYVIEKTPQGNVLMIYDNDRESFKYYSDSTIPYRYLEVVGRKYVKMFNCRPLFIDMEEELLLFETKWTKEYELKKAKEAEEKLKMDLAAKNNKPNEQKKSVFAKFKSYNKDAGGKISMAAPPKNSIPSKQIETKEDAKILLKERANHYTYEGKFANFNFLKHIEKKVFNKKLGMSFSDFKRMQKN